MTQGALIAFVCCDNGLGHIKRSFLFARALADSGIASDIYAPIGKFQRIESILGSHENVNNIDFSTDINALNVKGDYTDWSQWTTRIPPLDKYKYVISDNLLEIFEIRKDAIISANFLWNMVLNIPGDKYKKYCLHIRENENVVIGSEIFTPGYLKKFLSFNGIGLLNTSTDSNALQERGGVLFAAGKSGLESGFYRRIFQKISTHSIVLQYRKVVDEQFNIQGDVSTGCFDSKMYSTLRYAFIRPGLGTLNDLLIHGVIPVCVINGNNEELNFNASQVQKYGLGLKIEKDSDIDLVLQKLESSRESFIESIKKLNQEGISQFKSIFMSHHE